LTSASLKGSPARFRYAITRYERAHDSLTTPNLPAANLSRGKSGCFEKTKMASVKKGPQACVLCGSRKGITSTCPKIRAATIKFRVVRPLRSNLELVFRGKRFIVLTPRFHAGTFRSRRQ